MLQELAARTGASAWAIASMLFFVAVWLVVAARVALAGSDEMEARARLALEGDEDGSERTERGAPDVDVRRIG
jgi:hypothetical protein